jgi:hypothetical protein
MVESIRMFMGDFEWDWLGVDTDFFSEWYSNKTRVSSTITNIDQIYLGLTARYGINIRANCAHLFGMMAKFDLPMKNTNNSTERISRLILSGNDDLILAGLRAFLYFDSDKKISIQMAKHILGEEKFSELGFQIIEKQESKHVAKLLNIAFRDNPINQNWMSEI